MNISGITAGLAALYSPHMSVPLLPKPELMLASGRVLLVRPLQRQLLGRFATEHRGYYLYLKLSEDGIASECQLTVSALDGELHLVGPAGQFESLISNMGFMKLN